MKKVFVDIERCTACRSCEIACAVEHSASKNLFSSIFEKPSPQKRIHVEKALSFSYPSSCMNCADAACIAVCPTGATKRDPETGGVIVDEQRCMGCWMCAIACPLGAVTVSPEHKVAVKCDLCGSRLKNGRQPACVEACPTHALIFKEPEDVSKLRRVAAAEVIARAAGSGKQ